MKKFITKFWGVGLIIVLLSSLFVAGAPVSAADPLNWESKSDAPSSMFGVLAPGTDVVDYDVNGFTMYAITRAYGINAIITTAPFTEAVAGEVFALTYINDAGVAARAGFVIFTTGLLGEAALVVLQAGDTGVFAITNLAPVAGDVTAGTFSVRANNVALTVLATYDVVGGGTTIVANNPGADTLRQSTMGGGMWTNITARVVTAGAPILGNMDYVAIAPDDPNLIVVVDATPTAAGIGAAISIDGGATWTSMGVIRSLAGVTPRFLYGVDISKTVTGNFRYISVFGRVTPASVAAGSNDAGMWYYNYGSGVGTWRDATIDFTGIVTPRPAAVLAGTMDNIVSCKFSDNFPSDYNAVVLSEDRAAGVGTGPGVLREHLVNFNSFNWDLVTGYPVAVDGDPATGTYIVHKADIALNPEYDGGDDSTRIAFVSAAVSANTSAIRGGIWRVIDNTPAIKIYAGADIASVAYDGTNLIGGAFLTNNVVRTDDPMTATPTFKSAATLKRIGLDDTVGVSANDTVSVMFDVDLQTLYGGKLGTASAISKSTDYGATWNDFTLCDSSNYIISDIYVTPTGYPWYIAGQDNVSSCVYRIDSPYGPVTRVLTVAVAAGAPFFILRGIDADTGVLYAADLNGAVMYYTSNGGLSKWSMRNSIPANIVDVAAESATVVYMGNGINVYKSTSAGNTWNMPVNCGLAGGNGVNTMVSLGENNLLIGGTLGGVVYTTDGGTTWTATFGVFNTFAPVQVAATGLGPDDYIFAAEEAAGNGTVWRHKIGTMDFFKTMNLDVTVRLNSAGAAAPGTVINTGIAYKDGVLYVLATDPGAVSPTDSAYIFSTLVPTMDGVHTATRWRTAYAEAGAVFMGNNTSLTFNRAPSALKVSSGAPGEIMLYSIDTATLIFGGLSQGVYYYTDTLALASTTLLGPADGTLVQIISPLTGATQAVNFTWNRVSLATSYLLQIALDADFNEVVSGSLVAPIALGAVVSSVDPVSAVVPAGFVLPGLTYYWRVRATTPITSAWSEVRTFTVQPTAATVPNIASPEVGGVVDSVHPAFSWSPVSGSTMYRFELCEDIDFVTLIYTVDTTVAGAQLPAGTSLVQGGQYFWRVKSLAPVESDWSTVANFIVAEAQAEPTPQVTVTTAPDITVTIPPATTTQIVLPTTPPDKVVNPTYIWAIIIIGAILVIAVIVLIVRTRRSV